jgi:hypothetical protein
MPFPVETDNPNVSQAKRVAEETPKLTRKSRSENDLNDQKAEVR